MSLAGLDDYPGCWGDKSVGWPEVDVRGLNTRKVQLFLRDNIEYGTYVTLDERNPDQVVYQYGGTNGLERYISHTIRLVDEATAQRLRDFILGLRTCGNCGEDTVEKSKPGLET